MTSVIASEHRPDWQQQLTRRLLTREPRLKLAEGQAPASVLIPLAAEETCDLETVQIMLTRRASHLRRHAGQISFPGGRPEADDASLTQTALREAEEEIGIARSRFDLLGYLAPVQTSTGFTILPVLAGFRGAPATLAADWQPDANEVADIWLENMMALLAPDRYEQRPYPPDNPTHQVWVVRDTSPEIWGATAAILKILSASLHA